MILKTRLRATALRAFLLTFCWISAAWAQDTNAAFDRYRAGDYQGAIATGEAAGTGAGLAVAARAAFAQANLRDTPCLACLKLVEELARRSIMLDMNHPEAYVYLAAAYGYESRIIGYVRASLDHYPELARQAIDHALLVDPHDPWSLAALGGWHIEIVNDAGSFLARTLFGARTDLGEDAFRRAIAADPGNLIVRLQFVLSMSAFDFNRYRSAVAEQLAAIAMIEPRTAYEVAMKKHATELKGVLDSGSRADYLALVRRYSGYPTA